MPLKEALQRAEERELDLVEVAPAANPPVCKILDYGKYRYQLNKKLSAKHKTISVKEIKIRPQINEHDLLFKIKNIKRFLEQGNKAKITMMFRGREIIHASSAKKVFDRISGELTDITTVEREPKMEGNRMVMVLAPK